MTPAELREELEYLKKILSFLESWTLQQAARARIGWIEEELKRLKGIQDVTP